MKRSRRLATTRSSKRQSLPSWASWTEAHRRQDDEELERSQEDLWLRIQAFQVASKVIHRAVQQSLSNTNDIYDQLSELLRHCGQTDLDGTTTKASALAVPSTPAEDSNNKATTTTEEPKWKQFMIQENEPCHSTALPILLMDAPLEREDRVLWMKHLFEQLRASKRRVWLFENLNEYIQHRSASVEDDDDNAHIYMIQSVESVRMFGTCVQELAAELSDSCIVALQPAIISLDQERWSADFHVKHCILPSTKDVVDEFWKQMIEFPLAVTKTSDDTSSSLSATLHHVLRSSANILAHGGSFWAAEPILPKSLVQRARSIHDRDSIVHLLPAVGCLPTEWNETTKKTLLERLIRSYNALPVEVQRSTRETLCESILWLHETPTRHHLERLILPQYDGDTAQPRRETVRALMETSIGEQWRTTSQHQQPDITMDAYSKRHLAVCGLVRVLKNGAMEQKAHVWCAGD